MGVFVYMRVFVEEILMFLQRQTGGGFGSGSGSNIVGASVSVLGQAFYWGMLIFTAVTILGPIFKSGFEMWQSNRGEDGDKSAHKQKMTKWIQILCWCIAINTIIWMLYGAIPGFNQWAKPS